MIKTPNLVWEERFLVKKTCKATTPLKKDLTVLWPEMSSLQNGQALSTHLTKNINIPEVFFLA